MNQKPECVFLVDDDRSTNFFNSWLLKKLYPDCEVKVFKNGREAIDFLEAAEGNKGPELILLDVNMPVMNGFEFLRAFNEMKTITSHVMMMLTNPLLAQQSEEAKELGVTHFVTKPLTEEKVNNLLEKTLGS